MPQQILIVEDESAIADNILYALRKEGFEPVRCATGQEALRVVEEGEVSLIVLDVGLPDMSGFDLCKEIRASSAVPIIFLTARAGEVDRVVGLEIGGDDYMVKPFSPRELSARVKAVLRRTEGGVERDEPSRDLPFDIDEKRLTISYFGTTLELSRYEYRILAIMIRRPGWVYSRERLKELAWDEPESSLARTVDTHIKTIRSKLRAVRPDIDPVRTHRGLGYSLIETW